MSLSKSSRAEDVVEAREGVPEESEGPWDLVDLDCLSAAERKLIQREETVPRAPFKRHVLAAENCACSIAPLLFPRTIRPSNGSVREAWDGAAQALIDTLLVPAGHRLPGDSIAVDRGGRVRECGAYILLDGHVSRGCGAGDSVSVALVGVSPDDRGAFTGALAKALAACARLAEDSKRCDSSKSPGAPG